MKKILLFAAVALALTACTKEPTEQPVAPSGFESYDSVQMQFKFSPYEVTPMKTTSSVATVCSRLDVYIIEQGTTDTMRFHQDRAINATGFGSLTATLQTNRSYKLIVMGHNTSDTCTFSNGLIGFEEDKIKQCLYADTVFSPADGLSLNVVMQRIVGMFKLRIADADDEFADFDHMLFTISESGKKWNTATHESADRGVRTYSISGHSRGNDGYVTMNLYVMGDNMTDVKYVDITAQSYLTNGTVKETRQFAQVPIRDGYITTYTGTFYVTFGMGFTFEVGDWNEYGSYTF